MGLRVVRVGVVGFGDFQICTSDPSPEAHVESLHSSDTAVKNRGALSCQDGPEKVGDGRGEWQGGEG